MMVEYRVFFKRSVEKDLSGIPKRNVRSILNRVKALEKDPRPPGYEKMTGQERYRLRQGHYRIVYSIRDDEPAIRVVKVGHRKDFYR
jgi:mRNA interferase RelE/StbE